MEESHSPCPPSRSSSFELIRRLFSLRKISFSSECPSELTSLNFSVVCASRNAGGHLFSRQKIMHTQTTRNFALVNLWCGNLVPRVLSYPPYGTRERDTLENGINLVFWATELDTSLSSSICQPASICRYRARGLSLFRGDKVKMVIELDDLSSSVTYRARFFKRRKKEKKWKLKQ